MAASPVPGKSCGSGAGHRDLLEPMTGWNRISVVVTGAVGVVALAGCGGSGRNGNDENPGSSAAAATSAQVASEQATATYPEETW